MAIAVGGHKSASTTTGTTVTTAAITTTGGSGTVFLMASIWSPGVTATPSDSKTNSWVQLGSDVTLPTGDIFRVWRCIDGTGGASHTFTVTFNTSTAAALFVVEVTGSQPGSPLDGGSSNADTASPFTSPNLTTVQANECLVSFCSSDSGQNPPSPTALTEANGFTIQNSETNGATSYTGGCGTKIVSATGTYQSSWSESGGNNWVISIVGVKEASAPLTYATTHYRWFNDDGSESTATAFANEDVQPTLATATPKRVRGQVAITGGPPASVQVTLQVRKTGESDSNWEDVDP